MPFCAQGNSSLSYFSAFGGVSGEAGGRNETPSLGHRERQISLHHILRERRDK
jgi:hypothetical protein